MTLQHFQPKARITGDKMDLRNYYGRPLLVRVNEFVPDFSSQQYPNPKPVVFVDVVDLISGQIFINSLWGGGAVVDNLREHAGTQVVLPLMAQQANSGQGRSYIALVALDDNTAALAGQWHAANWGTVEQTRAQRMAAAQAAAPAQQAPAQNQFQQAAQQPQQGFGQPAQNQVQQPAAQPQQGFGGPVPGFQGQPNAQGQFAQTPNNLQPAQGQQPAQGFGQPQAQQPNYAQPNIQQQPANAGGMFSDQQPPMQPGQGFGNPQAGVDPAAANAALQQLNGQLS